VDKTEDKTEVVCRDCDIPTAPELVENDGRCWACHLAWEEKMYELGGGNDQ
jgi:hypothetical protein